MGCLPRESILFNRVVHYKQSILGYHYFWKQPNCEGYFAKDSVYLENGSKLALGFAKSQEKLSGVFPRWFRCLLLCVSLRYLEASFIRIFTIVCVDPGKISRELRKLLRRRWGFARIFSDVLIVAPVRAFLLRENTWLVFPEKCSSQGSSKDCWRISHHTYATQVHHTTHIPHIAIEDASHQYVSHQHVSHQYVSMPCVWGCSLLHW